MQYDDMLRDLFNWTIHWSATPQAVPALFFISFIESIFFPIPPDLLLIAMCFADPSRAFYYALICTVASVLGGVCGVFLGRVGGRPLFEKFVSASRREKMEKIFERYDFWAVAIAGFTPVPYKVFTIASGVFKIGLIKFVSASLPSRGGRFFLIAALIYYFGDAVKVILDRYFNLISIAIVVVIGLGIWYFRKKNGRVKEDPASVRDP